MDVKRVGIGVRLEEKTGEWRGYVRETAQGFSYSKPDLHASWVDRAQKKADSETCPPVFIDYEALHRPRPKVACLCFAEFEIVASVCRNGTYQLRFKCRACDARTRNAIDWDRLGSQRVIASIAYSIQNSETENTERTRVEAVLESVKKVENWVKTCAM